MGWTSVLGRLASGRGRVGGWCGLLDWMHAVCGGPDGVGMDCGVSRAHSPDNSR